MLGKPLRPHQRSDTEAADSVLIQTAEAPLGYYLPLASALSLVTQVKLWCVIMYMMNSINIHKKSILKLIKDHCD